MLTPQDIKNLTTYLKEVFVTKESFLSEMQTVRQNFSTLQASVDKIAKSTSAMEQEFKIFNYRTGRLEEWADQAVNKIGLKFET
jgi:hypothetical protein